MNLQRFTLCLILLMIAVISWTCGISNQTVDDKKHLASGQITHARSVDADKYTPTQLDDVEDDLEEAGKQKDNQKAYRLAQRAYFKAQYAEILTEKIKKEDGIPIRYVAIREKVPVFNQKTDIYKKIKIQRADTCFLIKRVESKFYVVYYNNRDSEFQRGYVPSNQMTRCTKKSILIPTRRENLTSTSDLVIYYDYDSAFDKARNQKKIPPEKIKQFRKDLTLPIFDSKRNYYNTILPVELDPNFTPIQINHNISQFSGQLNFLVIAESRTFSHLKTSVSKVNDKLNKHEKVQVIFRAINLSETNPRLTKEYKDFDKLLRDQTNGSSVPIDSNEEIFPKISTVLENAKFERNPELVENFAVVYVNELKRINIEGNDDFTQIINNLRNQYPFRFYALTLPGVRSENIMETICTETSGRFFIFEEENKTPTLGEPFTIILEQLLTNINEEINRQERIRPRDESFGLETPSQSWLRGDNDWFEPALLLTGEELSSLIEFLRPLAKEKTKYENVHPGKRLRDLFQDEYPDLYSDLYLSNKWSLLDIEFRKLRTYIHNPNYRSRLLRAIQNLKEIKDKNPYYPKAWLPDGNTYVLPVRLVP